MRKTLTAIAAVLVLALSATTASAVTVTLNTSYSGFLGSVDPGSPADADNEVFYVNFLLDQALGSTVMVADTPGPPTNDEHTFVRSSNPCVQPAPCPDATVAGYLKTEPPGDTSSLNLTNWTYLLAKYGNVSYVFFVANINSPDVALLPSTGPNGQGLSHYSLFNPLGVPDGGATLGLLGLGLLGLGYMRRRAR